MEGGVIRDTTGFGISTYAGRNLVNGGGGIRDTPATEKLASAGRNLVNGGGVNRGGGIPNSCDTYTRDVNVLLERGGEGAAAPERDRFSRACTGVGAVATRRGVRCAVSP